MEQISSKEEVDEWKDTHDNASNGVASLSPDPIYHIRDPGTTEDSGEGKDTHNNANIRLGAPMVCNEKRKEEEGAKT